MVTQNFTMPEFNQYILNLPKKFTQYIPEIQEEAAVTFQRMLKLRINSVSPYSVNNLKEGIKVIQKDKMSFDLIGPYYFKYVNLGVGPKWIPIEYLEQHMVNPNSPGHFVDKPKKFIHPESHYNEGVLEKTQDAFKPKYVLIIEKGINKALQK